MTLKIGCGSFFPALSCFSLRIYWVIFDHQMGFHDFHLNQQFHQCWPQESPRIGPSSCSCAPVSECGGMVQGDRCVKVTTFGTLLDIDSARYLIRFVQRLTKVSFAVWGSTKGLPKVPPNHLQMLVDTNVSRLERFLGGKAAHVWAISSGAKQRNSHKKNPDRLDDRTPVLLLMSQLQAVQVREPGLCFGGQGLDFQRDWETVKQLERSKQFAPARLLNAQSFWVNDIFPTPCRHRSGSVGFCHGFTIGAAGVLLWKSQLEAIRLLWDCHWSYWSCAHTQLIQQKCPQESSDFLWFVHPLFGCMATGWLSRSVVLPRTGRANAVALMGPSLVGKINNAKISTVPTSFRRGPSDLALESWDSDFNRPTFTKTLIIGIIAESRLKPGLCSCSANAVRPGMGDGSRCLAERLQRFLIWGVKGFTYITYIDVEIEFPRFASRVRNPALRSSLGITNPGHFVAVDDVTLKMAAHLLGSQLGFANGHHLFQACSECEAQSSATLMHFNTKWALTFFQQPSGPKWSL